MGKGKSQNADIGLRFIIGMELGEGGNARVFRAQKRDTGEFVALKKLEHFDSEKEERFLNEIHIMTGAASSIPGVLPVLEYSENHFWYTMPIAKPVMKEFNNINLWPAEKIVSSFVLLAETLEQLHDKSVSHRDIKPANIYFCDSRLCFGDFGLVDFPDAETLTHSDRALGSTFTIAPEMKRNPKGADGKPADVYSMAKTLWMMLTRDEKGFDGQYNERDRQHRLNDYEHLRDVHLLEIEELLAQSTETDPLARPTIKQFKEKLEDWLFVYADKDLCQERDWQHLSHRIFNGNVPESVVYKDREIIVNILNEISLSQAYNHMFIPSGGGLDLNKAEISKEEDCIRVFATGCWFVIKPKALHFESFSDAKWTYFLLETDPQAPVLSSTTSEWDEFVVEDKPGHYVDGTDACYGVYDYDSGIELPEGWRSVCRALKGSFLFVMKRGYYNQVSATYDGRHSSCSAEDFRKLIEVYQIALEIGRTKGLSDEKILSTNVFMVNPYKNYELPEFEKRLPSPNSFINNNYQNWQFSIPVVKDKESALAYYFSFNKEGGFNSLFYERKILLVSSSGKIVEKSLGDYNELLIVNDRNKALEVAENLNEQINKFCEGYDMEFMNLIEIKWYRKRKPTHMFTRDEMFKLYKEADDRRGNKLVIDEDGYAQMLPGNIDGTLYPVCHETFCSRCNNVGKYSALKTFEFDYKESLYAWLHHLQRGTYVYCDSSLYPNADEKTLLEKIKEYY